MVLETATYLPHCTTFLVNPPIKASTFHEGENDIDMTSDVSVASLQDSGLKGGRYVTSVVRRTSTAVANHNRMAIATVTMI